MKIRVVDNIEDPRGTLLSKIRLLTKFLYNHVNNYKIVNYSGSPKLYLAYQISMASVHIYLILFPSTCFKKHRREENNFFNKNIVGPQKER